MHIGYSGIVKSKKMVIRIALVFTAVIFILTFLSRTIDGMLLPLVQVEKPHNGKLDKGIMVNGELNAMDVVEIYAKGQWTIVEVVVKNGSKVVEGDVLAVVDSSRQDIENKKAGLELTRLKNSLEDYIDGFSLTNLKDYEVDVEKAQDELNAYVKNEKILIELYNSGAAAKTELEDAVKKRKDLQYDYERKARNLSEIKRQNSLKHRQYIRTVAEKQQEIELKEMEIAISGEEDLIEGKLIAKTSGTIKSISIEEGAEIPAGKLMFEIIPDESKYAVCWKLNGLQAEVTQQGDAAVFDFKENLYDMFEGVVEMKEYVPDQKLYKFTSFVDIAELDKNNRATDNEDKSEERSGVYEGLEVEVNIIKESQKHDIIIPSSAVQGIGKDSYIFILGERAGPLGREYYADKVEVMVDDEDDFNLAVSSTSLNREIEIITSSTKPLSDGERVKLR